MTGQITEAIGRWADELTALGGSEPLTRFRDAKVGTLDLSAADDPSRKKLLEGEPVRVSRLFPHEPLRSSAARSASRLARRLWQLESGHGIAAGYLATGLASWNHPSSTKRPNVPVLLRRLHVEQVGFGDPDLLLHVVGDPELNTALLEAMADQLGLRLSLSDLLDPSGLLRYPVVVDRLREQAPPHVVDGFAISHRAVIGLMSSIIDDVVDDLTVHASLLASRPFVALAAGARPTTSIRLDDAAPGDEGRATAIDLDSVQRRVLDAVATGSSVAVSAPAGTGATQVAAGLCADAVAAGRSVLVVAEGSSRLRGLRRRLAAIGLGGATLDLADGLVSTQGIARDVLLTIDSAARRGVAGSDTVTPGLDAASSERDRALLAGYVTALHEHRSPRALSAYQAISAAHAGSAADRAEIRIDAQALDRLDAASLERMRTSLADFIELDGLTISPQATAWFGAQPGSAQDAEQVVALVDRLRADLLPTARDKGARAAVEVGIAPPSSLDDLADLAGLLADVHSVELVFTRELWAAPVDRLAVATADRRHRRAATEAPGILERRTLRSQARSLARPGAADDTEKQASALATAADVAARWSAVARDGRLPRTGETAAETVQAWAALAQAVEALQVVHPDALPSDLDLTGTAARLATLAAESAWARRLPRLTSAAAELADGGMAPVVAELRSRRDAGQSVTPQAAVAVLDACVASSLAARIEADDPILSVSTGDELRAASQRWRQADAVAVVSAADDARRTWAIAASKASTERPVQVRVLRDALAGRGSTSTRELLDDSWQTVATARPIWLAGALPAAATLSLDTSFDLVIVLDAQSVALAHAVGVLARGEQVAVLGDPDQLPPAPTPVNLDAPDARSTAQVPGSGLETPSLYAVLRDQLPAIDLLARYGCRDARLEVAMPTRRGATPLAVPPGTATTSPLRFVHVEQEPGSRDQEESVQREVERVVELVVEHVKGRPSASLAVLTLGHSHAEAVQAALARACLTDAELAEAIGPNADEPFLLCPVDDLRGERRDAVILSVGYGRTMDGRLLYRYGPLNRPGGVRWLSAAVGTARGELTVVSSVTASDLEPRRLAADGLRALRQLLATAEGLALDGVDDPASHPALVPHPLDPLERSIAERLHDEGLPVVAGAGTSWLATALALEHRGRRGRGVLALEPEGGRFGELHHLRDRERLRPEQLMRAGWSVYRVCVLDWLRDPDGEVTRIRTAWEAACDLADHLDAARNAPPSGAGASVGDGARRTDEAEPSLDEPRPLVAVGRPVDAYPAADLVRLAEWTQSSSPGIDEDAAVLALGHEVGLAHPTGRTETLLRRAVRAAEIGHRPVSAVAELVVVDDPLPLLSAADEQERSQERAHDERDREEWLNDERPPHHEG